MPEGFSNPIIGGAETLIRSAMKSVNYVAGLMGWRLSRDGDIDLNNALIRGDLLVANATGAFVHIFNEVFPGNGPIIESMPNDRVGWTYTESHLLTTADANKPWVQFEGPGVSQDPGGYVANEKAAIYLYGKSSFQPMLILADSEVIILDGSTRVDLNTPQVNASDVVLVGPNQGDIGRGLVTSISAAGNSAAIGNAFTTIATTPNIDWEPDRAYEVRLEGLYQTSVANMAPGTAISASVGGTPCNMGRTHISVATTSFGIADGQNRFITDSVGVLNCNLQWRLTSATAAQTVTCIGPRQLSIYDIGPSTDYPNAPVL